MSRVQEFVQYFLSHRRVTEDLISKISEENYNYQPTPTSMSTEKLVKHILFTFYKFAKLAKDRDPEIFKQNLEETETNLQALARKYTDETLLLLESVTDDDFDESVDLTQIFGTTFTVNQLLHIGLDHEIHHKGNLFVYVRELGHTDLPFYIHRG